MQQRTYTLDDALDLFILDCASRRLTQSTQQFYQAKLSVFINWCKAAQVEYLHLLNTNHLRLFSVHIEQRNLTAQYQHNIMRAVRAFLNYAVRDELLKISPFKGKIQMPKLPVEVKPAVAYEDIKLILHSCGSLRDELIIN